jgi:hypothetical protein
MCIRGAPLTLFKQSGLSSAAILGAAGCLTLQPVVPFWGCKA